MRSAVGDRRRPAHVPGQEEQGRVLHADPARPRRFHDDRRCEPGLLRHDREARHNGRLGVKGKLVGYIRGTVTRGTFKPNATCTGPDCGFTDVFIATFFGSSAQFSCFTNSADCKFNFNYTAPAKSNPPLRYRHWQDKGKGAGTMLEEEFSGDIATA